MPIDINREELLTTAQAAKLLPPTRQGKPVSPSTVWRWIEHGSHGVRLEAVKLPHGWRTSAAALQRFFDERTRVAEQDRPRSPSEHERKLAADAAGRELERRFGI
jgi:hypothetical protein